MSDPQEPMSDAGTEDTPETPVAAAKPGTKGRRKPKPARAATTATSVSLAYLAGTAAHGAWSALRWAVLAAWRVLVVFSVFVLALGTVALVLAGYFYVSTVGEIPVLKDPAAIPLPQASTVYDSDGKTIGVITSQRRTIVPPQRIDQDVKDALVAIEDERFLDHEGVDFIGMARAVKVNYDSWRAGGDATKQGASTITQQYVRGAYLTKETTLKRKFKEIALAVQLEAKVSKGDILNRYLNTVYFGNGNYGVEAASRYYLGKTASDLTPYEAAVLVSTVNNPTIYDPTTEKGRASVRKRAYLVLDKMYQLGYIEDPATVRGFKSVPVEDVIALSMPKQVVNEPYYFDYVKAELFERYGKEAVLTGGWQVKTTLSMKRAATMKRIARSVAKAPGLGVGMTDIDPATGAIRAFLGGQDYRKSNFNLSTQGKRQPGSAFKPFVYATAFEQGMRNDSPFSNAPLSVPDGKGKTWTVSPDSNARVLQEGLAYSDNAMAARLILKTGVDPVIATARRLGITSAINRDAAIALGGLTRGVSTLEMASAYGSFANGGTHAEPYSIESISDQLGNEVYRHSTVASEAVNAEVAAMMSTSLQGVVEYGTAKDSVTVDSGRQVAGKTGTTDDHSDTWFVGYVPQMSLAVWLGYPNSRKPIPAIGGETAWGGTFTARMWDEYAREVLAGTRPVAFAGPKGLTEVPEPNGRGESAVVASIRRMGLEPVVVEVNDTARGYREVISVDHAGQLVKEGSSVAVRVAVQRYAVPDFAGMTPYEAVAKHGATFRLSFSVTFSDKAKGDGTVTAQSVPADSLMGKGDRVALSVAIKTPAPRVIRKEVQVPYIPSDTEYARLQGIYQSALTSLADERARVAGLSGDLKAERSRFVPAFPDLSGMQAATARSLLGSMGYRVKVLGTGDAVSGQEPAAGTVPAGKDATLTLSPVPAPAP